MSGTRMWMGRREPQLLLYRSFICDGSVRVIGRIIENVPHKARSSMIENALRIARMHLARPYAGVAVEVVGGEVRTHGMTDQFGMFEIVCPYHEDLTVHAAGQSARVEAYAPSPDAAFGIISDIDDTVLVSNATRTLKLLYLIFTKSAHARKPFPGVGQFYTALVGRGNPIFYVSSSAWTLYDLLIEFMDQNRIPKGPLLLKTTGGLRTLFREAGQHEHKISKVEMLLASYPRLDFILLGDSGQRDAEIYALIAQRYPGRIKAIYIRDVTMQESVIVKHAIESLKGKTDVVLTLTSEEAALHARRRGFIARKAEAEVSEGVAEEGAA